MGALCYLGKQQNIVQLVSLVEYLQSSVAYVP